MRANLRWKICAMDFTSNVLASPGAPVMRQCPPAKSAMRICSMTSCWPTMTLASSDSILVRPVVRRSTISRSESVCDGAAVGLRVRLMCLMGHGVKNDVDGERIRDFLRVVLEVKMIVALPFPAVAVVGVVRGEDNNAAFVVKNRPMIT